MTSILSYKPSVIFEITDACNLKCSFCYEDVRRAKKAVPLEVFQNVLRKYKPFYLQITGGEPTMHPQFEELLKIALKKCPIVQFTTNGTILENKLPFFTSLRKKPIIAISLDASTGLHDTIRGRNGLYHMILDVIPELQAIKVPVSFSNVVFGPGDIPELPDGNIHEVPELIELSRKLRVPINFQPFAPAHEETRKKLGEILLQTNSPYITDSPAFRKTLITGHNGICKYNLTNVSINTDGDPMSTVPGNCYFCSDCKACFYSCVWEPTLLTSKHFFSSGYHHLSTLVKLNKLKKLNV